MLKTSAMGVGDKGGARVANHQPQQSRKPETAGHEDEVKVVAEMPEDSEMREELDEMKANDGFPGSCADSRA